MLELIIVSGAWFVIGALIGSLYKAAQLRRVRRDHVSTIGALHDTEARLRAATDRLTSIENVLRSALRNTIK